MRHFQCLARGLDVGPILTTLRAKPDLWNQNTLRTTHEGSPHTEVDDIWCWFNKIPDNPEEVVNDIFVIPYRGWFAVPQLRPIVFDLMRRVEAIQLGRVIITRLAPGKKITPHIDMGIVAEFYHRFQIAIQSEPGAVFRIEDEEVEFQSGDCWMINNRATHSVENNSEADRIAVIVDVRLV